MKSRRDDMEGGKKNCLQMKTATVNEMVLNTVGFI
jgi:hypothetical protein